MKMQRVAGALGTIGMALGSLSCVDDDTTTPATCAAAKDLTGTTVDGPQMLFFENDRSRPWQAYCHGMSTDDPTEYLELDSRNDAGEPANYSEYIEYILNGVGGRDATWRAFSAKSRFDKVRIDPTALTLDITDKTFATTQFAPVGDNVRSAPVSEVFGGETVSYVPFGVAMQCGGDFDDQERRATANVDLGEAPFRFAVDGFCSAHYLGQAAEDASRRSANVDLSARGGSGPTRGQTVCGRASIECLPDPTINGDIPKNSTVQLAYVARAP